MLGFGAGYLVAYATRKLKLEYGAEYAVAAVVAATLPWAGRARTAWRGGLIGLGIGLAGGLGLVMGFRPLLSPPPTTHPATQPTTLPASQPLLPTPNLRNAAMAIAVCCFCCAAAGAIFAHLAARRRKMQTGR
jgi:hypothetical protein